MEIMEGGVFQSNRPPVRLNQIGIKPFSQLWRVSNGRRQSDDLCVRFDMTEPSQVDFKRRSSRPVVHEMEFIGNNTAEVGNQFCTMTQQGIQFFRGAHENVALVDVFGFGRGVADSQANRETAGRPYGLQILVLLHRQCFERYDVDCFGTFMTL